MTVAVNYCFDEKPFLVYRPFDSDNPFVGFECSLIAVLNLIADFDYIGIAVGLVVLVVE